MIGFRGCIGFGVQDLEGSVLGRRDEDLGIREEGLGFRDEELGFRATPYRGSGMILRG